MLNSKDIADIVISVLFVSTFICVFYFTYVVKVTENVINDQMDYIVKDLSEDLSFVPDSVMNQVKQYVKNIKVTGMEQVDKDVEESNKKIFWNVIKIIGISFIIGFVAIYISSLYFKFSMADTIKKDLIILIFVGLTEFVFLQIFGKHYISADPNFVKYTIIDRLQQMA